MSQRQYRLDFVVPAGYDITETDTTRSRVLESLRSALKAGGWQHSLVAPWTPHRDDDTQHLIVWIDLTESVDETEMGRRVAAIVGDALPGVRLVQIDEQPT